MSEWDGDTDYDRDEKPACAAQMRAGYATIRASELADLRQQLQAAEARATDLQTELMAAQQRAATAELEAKQAKEQAANSYGRMRIAEGKEEEVRQVNAGLRREMRRLDAEVGRLQGKLGVAEERVADLERQLSPALSDAAVLTSQLAECQEEQGQQRYWADKAEQDARQLQQERDALTALVAEQRRALEALAGSPKDMLEYCQKHGLKHTNSPVAEFWRKSIADAALALTPPEALRRQQARERRLQAVADATKIFFDRWGSFGSHETLDQLFDAVTVALTALAQRGEEGGADARLYC